MGQVEEILTPAVSPHMERRRARAITLMGDKRYGIRTSLRDPEHIILMIAIAGVGSGELLIPRDRYDPKLLMEVLP